MKSSIAWVSITIANSKLTTRVQTRIELLKSISFRSWQRICPIAGVYSSSNVAVSIYNFDHLNFCLKFVFTYFVLIIGEGAYSSVYQVRRHADGAIYALKKVKMVKLSDKEKENALNEVRILASIKH